MKKLGYGLLLLASILFFVIPVSIDWGIISPEYLDGFFLLELGIVIHAMAFMFFSELDA